jgi:uncharacterized BrkB/YihY/UPF0761 family membrane protein
VLELSAALAYYAAFSIGPLLVLIIGVGSLVMGRRGAQHQVHGQLQSVLGPKTASLLDSLMGARHAGGGLAATIVGAIGLALGATGVFVQLTPFGFRTGSVLKLAGARRTQSGTAKNLRPMKNNAKPLRPA